jgi:predicted metal-dependent peptidase
VWFGEQFVSTLTDAEIRFLILHECEHKALRQLTTYAFLSKKDPKLCNIAMDHVVNLRIMDGDDGEGFIKLIDGACYDTKYRGWSTKQVFDDLMQNGGGSGKGKGKGKGAPDQGQGDGNPTAGDEQGSMDEHDIEGAEALTQEEKDELKKDIEQAIRQGGLLAGKNGGGSKNRLDDVLESQIRWQEILAEFIKSVTKGRDSSSWSRINRRWVSSGMYLPSTVSETIGGLLLAGDASGSTWSGNQLAGFLGEAKAIIEDVVPDFVDFMWWDTKVQVVHHFVPEDYPTMIEKIKEIVGGGGTAPSCITDWIKEQKPKLDYVAAVVLTDGQVGNDWGDWTGAAEMPVLFCVNTKGITAPIGQTLYIAEADF